MQHWEDRKVSQIFRLMGPLLKDACTGGLFAAAGTIVLLAGSLLLLTYRVRLLLI